MKALNFILIFMLILICENLFSFQGFELCRIIDKDGYTNIRKGMGLDFEVVDKLLEDELFYCKFNEDQEWFEIKTFKGYLEKRFNYNDKLYIHKSRVESIKCITLVEKKELLLMSFVRYRDIGNQRNKIVSNYNREEKKWLNKSDSLIYVRINNSFEYEHETRFIVLLQETFSNYFCATKDQEVIEIFFEAIFANDGSASESPSFALGECYLCHPDTLINWIKQIKNEYKKKYILMQLDWGIQNVAPELADDFLVKTKGL